VISARDPGGNNGAKIRAVGDLSQSFVHYEHARHRG
jgi:hypothetical protein